MADRPSPKRLKSPRLRLIAIGAFAAPLVALPLYAAVKNMPVRHPARVSAAVPAPKAKPAPLKASTTATPPKTVPISSPATAAADNPFVVRRILDTGGPIRYGDYFWDEGGAPAGPLIITVDLAAETISAFRDGYEIGTAAIIFGAEGKATPLGTFPITQKDADHISNLYHAPMPYMLRLTNDGVSIHGSKISYDYATHGCIGVPMGFAKKLFGVAKLGDKVIVTKGKMMDVGHPILPNA